MRRDRLLRLARDEGRRAGRERVIQSRRGGNPKDPRLYWLNHQPQQVPWGQKTAGSTQNGWQYGCQYRNRMDHRVPATVPSAIPAPPEASKRGVPLTPSAKPALPEYDLSTTLPTSFPQHPPPGPRGRHREPRRGRTPPHRVRHRSRYLIPISLPLAARSACDIIAPHDLLRDRPRPLARPVPTSRTALRDTGERGLSAKHIHSSDRPLAAGASERRLTAGAFN